MRPSLNILEPDLTDRIADEAKLVLAEVGMEIRGKGMRQRLLAHGLPLDHSGQRVLFPRDVVEQAPAANGHQHYGRRIGTVSGGPPWLRRIS